MTSKVVEDYKIDLKIPPNRLRFDGIILINNELRHIHMWD